MDAFRRTSCRGPAGRGRHEAALVKHHFIRTRTERTSSCWSLAFFSRLATFPARGFLLSVASTACCCDANPLYDDRDRTSRLRRPAQCHHPGKKDVKASSTSIVVPPFCFSYQYPWLTRSLFIRFMAPFPREICGVSGNELRTRNEPANLSLRFTLEKEKFSLKHTLIPLILCRTVANETHYSE